MLAFALVLTVVIFTSAKQAGFIVAETERKLITQELDRELESVVQIQAEISFWDATIEALQSSPAQARDFWQSELVQWFTWDADFQLGVVLDQHNDVVFAAELGEEVSPRDVAFYVSQNADLIEKARERFDALKVDRDGRFLAPVGRLTGLPDIAVGGYRYVDGDFGIVTAQIIVGETEAFAIGADGWHVLFGFLPLEENYLSEFAQQLGLDPRYVELASLGDGFREAPHVVAYPNAGGEPEAYLRWRPKQMGMLIMSHIAPFAALLFALLVAAVLIPLRAFSRTVVLLAQSEAMNRKMANHDALTGLPNRMQFDNKLEDLLADQAGDPFAVMCIDLDRFKAVNDAYGHNAGDAVLVTVAERLAKTIGANGLVARVGGDEFVAIITENVDNDHLSWLGDALIDQATQPVMFGPVALEVGCSIGVSIWPRHGRSATEIIGAADTFLYESKRAGRGRVTIGCSETPSKKPAEAVA